MRIACFNWRDIRNPRAGGAEVFVHQVLRRFAEQGHKVTLFTASYSDSPEHETIDGVEHMRYGGKFLIYPKSYFCYKKHIEGKYDVIIESINGPPFFTCLFAREKVVPFIHQLTRENWYSGLFLHPDCHSQWFLRISVWYWYTSYRSSAIWPLPCFLQYFSETPPFR